MKFDILNRFTCEVQFTAEIECAADALPSVKLGLAVKAAIKDGARLDGARLDGASLDGASLDGASLVGASLDGARLVGASLDGARGVIHLGCPDGWHAHAWLRDGFLSIRVGCQELRLDEARSYWAGKDDRREVLAAVEYAASVAAIRGWSVTAPAIADAAEA